MKIAILEDTIADYNTLKKYCARWSSSSGIPIVHEHFTSGEEFLTHFQPGKYHLIFLDIYMDRLTGIDIATQIRKTDMNCLLVFTTTSTEHVWNSMSVHPFDYLVKPYDSTRIDYVLSEAAKLLPESEKSLELTHGRQKISVLYSEIVSLQADIHHVIVTTSKDESLRCYVDSFSSLWNMLNPDSRFICINRGIILNMDYIEGMREQNFVMKNGHSFPIRQNNQKAVIQTFLSYQYKQTKLFGRRYLQ